MLRHSFCTFAISGGKPVNPVSIAAGHASAAFTMDQYADALPQDLEDVSSSVADALLRPVVAKR
jgi:integrase